MDYLNQIFENNLPNYLYASKVIQIKNDIYSFLQGKIIELISIVNNNGKNELVNPLLNILLEVNTLIRSREQFLSNIIDLLDKNIKKENEKIVSQSNNFIKENSKLQYLVNEKEKEYNLLETNNKLLEDKFDQINNENLDMMQKIINKTNPKKKNLKIEDLDTNTQTKSKKYSSQYNTTSPKNYNNSLNKNSKITSPIRQKNNTEITIKNYHNLSKDQLLNLIENIYRSKSICNFKCEQSKKPIETMEQHLYEYLNQRYGLKNLTIEYASTIIKAIKDYSNISSEILLFGMILKNELEENSINISNQIKKVINDS